MKRCCGERRGPSEDQLARAHLAALGHQATADIAGLSDLDLEHLFDGLLDLPAVDLSLHVTLPKLIGPDLQRLFDSIVADQRETASTAAAVVLRDIDTPRQRAQLADALVRLRDRRRISGREAAAAILDLDSRSTRFITASFVEAVALAAGATSTPAGLHLAA